MKKNYLKQMNKIVLVLLILSMICSIISIKSFANTSTANLTIGGIGITVSNGVFSIPNKGTATFSVNGILQNVNTLGIDNIDLNSTIVVTLNAGENLKGILWFNGSTLDETTYCTRNGQTATYTFTLAELHVAAGDGKSVDIEFADINNPGGQGGQGGQGNQEVPVPSNAILLQLLDIYDNPISYNIYHNNVDFGVTVKYSYDNVTWSDLSNYDKDEDLTQAFENNKGYTYAFTNKDKVYIKVTESKGGNLQSKAINGYQDGPELKAGAIEIDHVYTLSKKNDVYDLIFRNGMYTVIWSYSKTAQEDMIVENGTVRITTIDGKDVSGESGNTKEGGFWTIKEGAKVTIELKPAYGYQFISGGFNGMQMVAGDEVNKFEFTMPSTNLHFAALFQKVDNKINAESDKVQSGNIEIASDEIDSGSVELSVEDIDLTEEQIFNFKEAASEYNISSYLNINLDQVIYKGSDKDAWKKELKELNKPATVTLQLEEGVNGNEIVIVHEKHDGTYEIIPTTYDEETRTLSFTTTSFSNYAIASRTVTDIKNPKTGDNIAIYGIILGISLIGVITTNVVINKKKKHNISK